MTAYSGFYPRYYKLVGFALVWFALKILVFLAYLTFDGAFLQFEQRLEGTIAVNESSCLDEMLTLKSTNDTFTLVCIIYIVIASLLGIVVDVHEVILSHKTWYKNHLAGYFQTSRGRKKLLYDYGSHRTKQFFVNAAMLFHVGFRLFRYHYEFETSQLASGLVHFLIVSQIGTTLVFFLQIVPKVGFYAVIFQRMSSLFMFSFLIIFFLVALPYVIPIQRVVNFAQPQCQDNFANTYQTMYSIFLLTFNMIDFTDVEGSSEYLITLYVIHIVFVMLFGVLLLNFLIALFTNYVGDVLDKKHIVVPVHVILILAVLEMRLERHFRTVLRRLEIKRFVRDRNGRIYVARTVVANERSWAKGLDTSFSKHTSVRQSNSMFDNHGI